MKETIETKPKVKLVGENGNAFAIMARAARAARRAKWSKDQIDEYQKAAMSGDYDNLLQVTMQYFDVD